MNTRLNFLYFINNIHYQELSFSGERKERGKEKERGKKREEEKEKKERKEREGNRVKLN
jgi:hypothetical protein